MVIKTSSTSTPALKHGDRLTRDEFERRYEAMPENAKAELIEGTVYMAPPVRHDQHGRPHLRVAFWLGHYQAFTPGTDASDNGTIRLDMNNEPQPDAFLFIEAAKGGQAVIDEDGYVVNAPELVLEVAASSASIDIKKKLPVYLRNKVREYIVWRVEDGAIDWFVLRGGDYQPVAANESGILKSEVFPGLWLDTPALLRGDMPAVFETLERGLATTEHGEFVKRLNG